MPGVGHGYVVWNGERVTVISEHAGLHWASVNEGKRPRIVIRERIVALPGRKEADKPAIPMGLKDKVTRTSSAVTKLLCRAS